MSEQLEQSQGVISKQKRKAFVMCPNHLFTDPEISSIAKTMWQILESKPEGWKFYWSEIQKHFKEGRDAVRKSMKELEQFGYVQRKKAKKGNLFSGMDIQVFYDPALPYDPSIPDFKGSARDTEIQYTENQLPEFQGPENQGIYKERSKQDLSKQDLLSLSDEEEREFFKNLWEKKNYKSDFETFLLSPSRKKWAKDGLDLQEQAAYWEDGFKKKNPDLYKASASVTKAAPKDLKREKFLYDLLARIKTTVDLKGEREASRYFSTIEEKDGIVYVTDKRALKYKDLLAQHDIKIELK